MTRVWRSLLLVGVSLWPTAVRAQGVPSAAQCREFLSAVPFMTLEPSATRVAGTAPDTCRYDGVLASTGTRTGYRADTLTVAGIGFNPNAALGPPMTLRAKATGVGATVHTGNANVDWMLAEQRGAGFAVVLDLTFDPTSKVMTLRELSLDGERIGRVAIDGEVADVQPISIFGPDKINRIAIRRLHLRIDSRSFAASYVLPPFIATLPASTSVAATQAEVDRRVTRASAGINTLLRAIGAPAVTVAAVDGMIADFPHQRHPFEVSASATNPVTLGEIGAASESIGALAVLASRVVVEATYAGAFRP